MKNPLVMFAIWFLLVIVGGWFIWASYMAIKFMSEVAQGQHAAFSLIDKNSQVGALIVIPAFLSVIWVIAAAIIANELADE